VSQLSPGWRRTEEADGHQMAKIAQISRDFMATYEAAQKS
jgi:hypothetical protein